MNLDELRKRFVVPGVTFDDQARGLIRLNASSPTATGALFLHGAHCSAWQPAGHSSVLWMSQHSYYQPDKPIRGGVPICFPWFGPHASDKTQPAHGHARVTQWELESVALDPDDTLHVRCVTQLQPFELEYRISFGMRLKLSLTTRLPASHGKPEQFEDALHTYLSVSDIHQVQITGLESIAYIDKVDGAKVKAPSGSPIRFTGETDRVYFDTSDTCVLQDPAWARRIVVSKKGSRSTIVWNPWIEKSARMPDFGNDEWPGMVCIETANVGSNTIQLNPGEHHTTVAEYEVAANA